jgi:FkbM family methyltransferase
MSFHSEYGQDEWLASNVFPNLYGGLFVEAGALDGLLDSNTLFFERERRWRGILIEANPTLLPELRANRPLATVIGCALDGAAGEAEFEVVSGRFYGWSGFTAFPEGAARRASEQRRTVTVRTRPLGDVLREHAVHAVDYLSLDVEGAEFDVLSAYPFTEIPIRVLGVEDNSGSNQRLAALLTDRGFRKLARVGVDDFWINQGEP